MKNGAGNGSSSRGQQRMVVPRSGEMEAIPIMAAPVTAEAPAPATVEAETPVPAAESGNSSQSGGNGNGRGSLRDAG
ncbi:MAG: hypothetical protein ACLTSZ_08970 [Lachnospiraceae bacterium]